MKTTLSARLWVEDHESVVRLAEIKRAPDRFDQA